MLQGKFDYVKVTYYGQVREGYLVDVSNGTGTLAGLNANTAFQMSKARIEVLIAGSKSFLPKFENFFAAIAMIASQEVDPFTLTHETVEDWIEADSAFMAWMEAYHGLEEVQ